MSKQVGVITNINNKYVILHDKHYIKESAILYSLLPNDTVEYEIQNDKIILIRLLERETQIIFGIIKNIDVNTNTVHLSFPNLPKFFSLQVPNQTDFNINSIVLLKVGKGFCDIIKVYDSIQNRANDKDLFITLYEEQSKICSIIPLYENSKSYYTEDYRDLTHLETFNVDPTESKDFDDAISIDEINSKIYVHIVDANEQIEKLSNIDINAFQHSFTLYLTEQVKNILPASLAEDKLSLIEGQDRKTITVELNINPETYDIVNHSIYKSLIKINKRYDYNEFNNSLYNFPMLLAFYNKWKRQTLNIPHLKINVNKNTGKLLDYELQDYFDDAHKIIETLMILTNLKISEHVGTLVPQRYHSKIKSEIMLQNFTHDNMINSIISIKKYKPAIYNSTDSGHFGLGLKTYTHFTSPIRRYFDVIIHRLLAGNMYKNIEVILSHINKQEIYIDKLIKCYNNLKLLTYFEEKMHKIWCGYVLSINSNGITVILQDNLYELFIFNTDKCNKTIELYNKVDVKIKSINWVNLTAKAFIM
jgi:ribonuclease R